MEIIIKLDHDEPVKVKTASTYGEQHPEELRAEIQDLKLENDRLKKRDAIMLKFVKSAYCRDMKCNNCLFFDYKRPVGKKCIYNRNEIFADISNVAGDVLKELDNL